MPSTSRGYPYPSGSDDVDIPGDMQALAAAVNTDVGTVVTNAAAASAATIQNTLADAAGDLIVASANDTWAKKSLGTDNHVLTIDTAGSGAAKVAWEDPTANPLTVTAMATKVNTSTVGNLLPTAQASLTSGLMASGTTVAYSSPNATVTTTTGSSGSAYSPYSSQPVVAGQVYTATSRITAVTGSRTWTNAITYFTSGGVNLGSTFGNSLTAAGTARVSAVAPATAAYAAVTAIYGTATGGVIGDTATITEFGFWAGAGGQWALPGTPIANLGFYTDESCGRRLFQWDANNARWQQTYSDTGDRQSAITYTNGWANAYGVDTLRRIGNTVHLHVVLDSTSATTDDAFTVPVGFQPSSTATAAVPVGGSTTVPRTLVLASGAAAVVYRASLAGQAGWFVNLTYQTNDAWPTTLPGSAVGSIPA